MTMKKSLVLALSLACVIAGIVILSCDDSSSSKKSSPTQLIMFGTAATHDGNLGGRSGADTLCRNDANKPASISTVHALISVSADDSVANMPSTFGFPDDIPIMGPDGETVIADNWADLSVGGIDRTLLVTGVFSGIKSGWWSGSNPDGSYAEDYTCSGWTNNTSGNGEFGNSDFTDEGWISYDYTGCSGTYYLVGIGF